MAKKILLIGGSLNQTTMMHKIALHLGDHQCYFTPYYADGVEGLVASTSLLSSTVLGGRHYRDTMDYLDTHRLPLDMHGRRGDYDLVLTASDLIVPRNIRHSRILLVQEGITEAEGWIYPLVRHLKLPRYLANTAATGLSDAYDIFCVASHGYRDLFIRKGVRPGKIAVTGIPNFDDLQALRQNDFPERDFVLVVTSPYREVLQWEDRPGFIRRCVRIADGRKLIFKLHPLENVRRATAEINKHAPGALVYTSGNVNHMIANASVVITQKSSATFVALALGKELHTYLDVHELRRLMPIQNGGSSALRIANIARRLLNTPLVLVRQARRGVRPRPRWEKADAF